MADPRTPDRSEARPAAKFLTLRQPWASLIAVGAKTIETRPFSTKYRGPLAIHAGREWTFKDFVALCKTPSAAPIADALIAAGHVEPHSRRVTSEPSPGVFYAKNVVNHDLPLGAVVAVCDLVNVMPIWGGAGENFRRGPERHRTVQVIGGGRGLVRWGSVDYAPRPGSTNADITDQLPFGDFTPGRYAWLLDNVRAVDPVPMKGAQGLRDLPVEIVAELVRRGDLNAEVPDAC